MKKRIFSFFALSIIFFGFSFFQFPRMAPKKFFDKFQWDSETLVLGKIIADREKLSAETNLVFASVKEHSLRPIHRHQSYVLINNKTLPDLRANYVRNAKDLILVTPLQQVEEYLGRKVRTEIGNHIILTVKKNMFQTNINISNFEGLPKSGNLTLEGKPPGVENLLLTPYKSQFGLQGLVFSFFYNKLGFNLVGLHLLSSTAFAITIAILTLFFSESLGLMFAACFFISVFTFPWIQAFAKNLYWIPFTWFLPAVFTLKYYLASNTKYSFLWLVGFFFSVLFKSMCGYEYISTIILFASAIFLIDPFLENPIRSKNHSFLLFTLTCLIATLAFFTALIFHAYTRGDTIGAGLLNIFDEDVKRSTIVVIDSVYKSHIDVLKRFIFKRAYYMLGIGGKFFGIAFILALTISTLKIFTNKPSRARDFVLLAVFSMAPMSWFILAKEHSRLHTHISFVLWCLGCSAAIWFIIVKNIKCIFFKILDLNRIKVSRTYF